jgi:DNA-binding transcriptional MerR regulator
MNNEYHSAAEACRHCSISYRTLIRWVEQGVYPPKHLYRRDGRIFVTIEGYKELKILGRLRKHLPIRKLRRFIDHFHEHDNAPIEGEFAILKGPTGERKVLWETMTGEVIDLVNPLHLQLSLFNCDSLEAILDD